MQIKKLCISVPTKGTICTETAFNLISASFYTMRQAGCSLHYYMPSGGMMDDVRNQAAREAMEIGASHLMFIDSDMVFPEEGIMTLASRDKLVIGANYNLRQMPLRSTVKISDVNGQMVEVFSDKIPKIPFKCYAVGTGFTLIRTEVFRRIPKPWFYFEYDAERDATRGEDILFCKKARENGIDIWCDPTIQIGHIGEYIY